MGKEHLTLGSLFDGIGGWLASAVDCGIKPCSDYVLRRLAEVVERE